MADLIQNEYFPDEVSPPGETLEEVLQDRQMTQVELADRTGRTKKTINEIVRGKSPISPETALQLERVLGVPADFWNSLESNYREFLARREEDERLRNEIDWLKKFPVRDMEKLGWIETHRDKVARLRELLSFFGLASPSQWEQVFERPQAAYRKTTAFDSQPGALAAWLRRGERLAARIRCAPYDQKRFESALREARKLTTERPEVFQERLEELCAKAGVALVFVPQVKGARASGATRWLSPTKALVQLSLRYKKDDQLWFSFFHEAGHILLHGKKLVFIEGDGDTGEKAEDEANRFAADFLIPPEALVELEGPCRAQRLSKQQVLQFAQTQGISPGIVVGRLQHLKWLPYTHMNDLKQTLRWSHEE